jgi:predicted ArsR family transcriptional regulator
MTNKQIAQRVDRDPGTVLHHVRELVRTGFLAPDDIRTGKRGALERPYRATGKSWRLRLVPNAGATVSIMDAAREELLEAGPEAVIATLRLGVRLNTVDLAELKDALSALGDDYSKRDNPAGEPIGIVAVVHRRSE